MAYTVAWDEASPPGATTDANTIDTEFQNLKISIRERIEQVIPDWSDDTVDPKRVLPSVAKVEKTALQSIPASTSDVVLTWDAEVFDPDTPTGDPNGLFDSAVSTSRFTIIRDGYYNIHVGLQLDGDPPNSGNIWTIKIVKNGSIVIHRGAFDQESIANHYRELSTLAELVDGDYVEAWVSNNAGTANSVDVGSEFWIHMVNNL